MARQRSQSNPNPRRARTPYTYCPLPSPRHIRLIRFLYYDPLLSQAYITLTSHPIDTAHGTFTAVSYTWGDPTASFDDPTTTIPNPHTIDLLILPEESFQTFRRIDDLAPTEGSLLDIYTPENVHTLSVPGANLSDFLRAYATDFPARQLKGGGVTFAQAAHLWIDAVCIDQGNAAEKAAQIPLMGEVYSRAARVVGWLGAAEERWKGFCWWHAVVYPALRRFVEGWSGGKGEAMGRLREGNFVEGGFWSGVVGLNEVPVGGWVKAWMEYWGFYRTRRYFQRAWIVQEVVVAGRFTVMAGRAGEGVGWDDMMGFAFFLGHVGWLDGLDSLAGQVLSPEYTKAMARGFLVTDIAGLQQQHRAKPFENIGWPEHWWAALSAVRRRECFVQQDRVFATVGILQLALPEGTPLPFPIDPNATTEEVFIHAATALVLNCPQLTLLSFIEHPFYRTLKSLPSWVPDLTTAKFPMPLGAFDTPFEAFVLPSFPTPKRIVTPSGELHLRGFKFDTVSSKTQYEAPMNVRLAERALEFLASQPLTYPHVEFQTEDGEMAQGQFREAALVHTLTCYESSNVNRGTEAETRRLMVSFRDWLLVALGQVYAACLMQPGDEDYSLELLADTQRRRQHIEEVIGGLESKVLVPDVEELMRHGEAVIKARRGDGPWPDNIVSPQEFKDQIRRVMLYRCLFSTTEGWIGVCQQTCEVGDEVWLLEGGAVPYVLRRHKGGDGEETSRFTFCGECYVHGIMKGELVGEGANERRLQEVVIL